MDDLLKVGVIANTHGLGGEVKVFPTTDDVRRFLDLEHVILDTGKEKKVISIERVRFHKNMAIIKFEGFDDINDVQIYRGKDLFVTRDQAVPLGENEYFIADLIGLRAVSDEGRELGEVADVLQSAANDVYVIKREGEPELLVPAIHDCVKNVDLGAGVITLHLLPGLLEINQKNNQKKKEQDKP